MPKASKPHRILSYQKCKRCRADKAKVAPRYTARSVDKKLIWGASVYLKVDNGLGLVACDANALTTSAPRAVQRRRRPPPLATLINPVGMQVVEEPLNWETSMAQSRTNRPTSNMRGLMADDELYLRKGQTQRWLYLREQARQVLKRVSIELQPGRKLSWNLDDPGNYDLHESHELVELHIRRTNFHKAEFLLEDIVLYFRDHPRDPKFSWYLSMLIFLYTLSVDRIKRMTIAGMQKELSTSLSILDRIARIDIDVLSCRVIDSHLIKFQNEFDLGMAFHFAVNHGACNLACMVLDRGAHFGATFAQSMACRTGSGNHVLSPVWKPLHIAVDQGHIDMVRLLLAQGADVETTTPKNSADPGLRPLHIAVMNGSIAIVVYLLSQNANIEAECGLQKTPLIWAACRKDPEIVRVLLDRGARADQLDIFRRTALHHAAREQRPANLRMIINAGADIMARDAKDGTALHLAAVCARANTTECMDILLDIQVDVDATDRERRTALHIASSEGNSVAVEHLISQGASLSAEGSLGTPLHEAAAGGYGDDQLATIKALIKNGAEVNRRRSGDGKTPLHVATHKGFLHEDDRDVDVLHALCAHGAKVHLWDNKSKTALDYAKGKKAATAVLMEYLPKAPLSHQEQSLAPTLGPQWAQNGVW
ncbi:MAG: hypothetical protein Q9221_002900 [Calogaya cf. arnoldii]